MYTYQFKQEEVYYIMQLQHFKQQDFFSILQIYHFKQLLLDASIGVKQVLLDHASSTLTSLINLNDNVEENACLLSALYAIHSINKKTCFLSVYYCCAQWTTYLSIKINLCNQNIYSTRNKKNPRAAESQM